MSDQSVEPDTDLRRRAAWLLAMLVLVAVLVVVVMTTLLGTDNGGDKSAPIGPDPITSTGPPSPGGITSTSKAAHHSSGPAAGTSTTSSGPSVGTSAPPSGATTCPTSAPCALDTDVGNGVAAVNAYRTQHGMSAVPGSVSAAAKTCALNRGDGCSGGWAETEISAPPNGTLAVRQIQQFAKLLTPMKAIQVGWAYFPSSKTYAFVTIRQV